MNYRSTWRLASPTVFAWPKGPPTAPAAKSWIAAAIGPGVTPVAPPGARRWLSKPVVVRSACSPPWRRSRRSAIGIRSPQLSPPAAPPLAPVFDADTGLLVNPITRLPVAPHPAGPAHLGACVRRSDGPVGQSHHAAASHLHTTPTPTLAPVFDRDGLVGQSDHPAASHPHTAAAHISAARVRRSHRPVGQSHQPAASRPHFCSAPHWRPSSTPNRPVGGSDHTAASHPYAVSHAAVVSSSTGHFAASDQPEHRPVGGIHYMAASYPFNAASACLLVFTGRCGARSLTPCRWPSPGRQ